MSQGMLRAMVYASFGLAAASVWLAWTQYAAVREYLDERALQDALARQHFANQIRRQWAAAGLAPAPPIAAWQEPPPTPPAFAARKRPTSGAAPAPGAPAPAPDTTASPDPGGTAISATPAAAGHVVVSVTGKKYHLPTCSHVKRIKAANRREFPSPQAAKAQGYSPCASFP